MASRVLFKGPLLTFLSAGLLGYSAIPVALAETKKSIYDDEEEVPKPVEIKQSSKDSIINTELINNTPIKSSKFLEENIEIVRKWLYNENKYVQSKVDDGFQSYLNVEKSVSSTISNLKDENEDILPGAIYVLIATLSGSIFAHRRGFVVRSVAPIIFGIGAFNYFLPSTFKNTRQLIWSFEEKSPVVADTHIQIQNKFDSLTDEVKSISEKSQSSLESGVHSVRKFISDSTGLQISTDEKKK